MDDCPQNTQVNSEPAEINVWDEQEKHSKNWLTVSNFSQLSMLHVTQSEFQNSFQKEAVNVIQKIQVSSTISTLWHNFYGITLSLSW